jgi:hypothetical protein
MIETVPSPADADASLRDAGLDPRHWSAGPRTEFATHSHPRPKRLFVLRGSISFNGDWLDAPAGIRIPAGYEHSAVAGPRGVDCVEAFE